MDSPYLCTTILTEKPLCIAMQTGINISVEYFINAIIQFVSILI